MFDELRAAIADSWESFCSLPHMQQKTVLGVIVATIALSVLAWKFVLALGLVAISVALYLKRKSSKGEL